MRLTQCPYDGTAVHIDVNPAGSVVLECPACEATWEYHHTWIAQRRKPNRNKARAARRRALALAKATPQDALKP